MYMLIYCYFINVFNLIFKNWEIYDLKFEGNIFLLMMGWDKESNNEVLIWLFDINLYCY